MRVGPQRAAKASQRVGSGDLIEVDPGIRVWVSRGSDKLLAALEGFHIEVAGRRCIDVGSSTGGFTEVLLDRGAASVVALDVGSGQLHSSLRGDPRVEVVEETNIRHADLRVLGAPFDLVVADLSFISLRLVAGRLAELIVPNGDVVVLVKPQFEVQKADLGKGGILRDEERRRHGVEGVIQAMQDVGLGPQGLIRSPVRGNDGNVEFLLWCRRDAPPHDLEVPA